MAAWLDALTLLEREGEAAVLVTLLAVRGSAPREAGCKMVISRNRQFGTVGGGALEFRCVEMARALLEDGGNAPARQEFPLGPAFGQCCGGHVSVLLEPMRPAVRHIALFGAGHVGRALVRLLGDLPCRVTWFNSRPEALPGAVPGNVATRVLAGTDRAVAGLPSGSHLLVMTHDHQEDFDIVAEALRRDDLPFIGLIGSETKRARFLARLRRLAITETALARLACPIGVQGIASKLPEAIAIAVAAQILQGIDGMTMDRPVTVSDKTAPALSRDCHGCARAGIEVCA